MSTQKNQNYGETIAQTNVVGVDFLLIEADAALTFLHVAETSASPVSRARNYENAVKGYQTLLHFLPRVIPAPAQLDYLRKRLELLRRSFQQAGISVEP